MIGERIREVRKELHLTQAAFADRLGMKRNSIAQVESGRNTSDQTINAICREFRVNEVWLRTGEGEMFVQEPETLVDALCERYRLPPAAKALLNTFITLPDEQRAAVLDFTRRAAAEIRAAEPGEPTREQLHAALDRELDQEKEAEERSGA